jgi:hypothetical protein
MCRKQYVDFLNNTGCKSIKNQKDNRELKQYSEEEISTLSMISVTVVLMQFEGIKIYTEKFVSNYLLTLYANNGLSSARE